MGSGVSSGQGSPEWVDTVADSPELEALLQAYKVSSPEAIAGTQNYEH